MLHIDQLTVDDIEDLLALEQENLSAWSRAQLVDELRLTYSWSLAARESGCLIGYIFGTIVVDEAEIRKIAVRRSCRQQGIAANLLKEAFVQLRQAGVLQCFLELRASNLAALKLYLNNGFYQSGLRKEYYSSPDEDAILLQKVIAGAEHKRA